MHRAKTPLEKVLQALRLEASPCRSEAGTPYSTVSDVEEPEVQKSFFRVATFTDADAVRVSAIPKTAKMDIEYIDIKTDNHWVDLPELYGIVTKEDYEKCLSIYENNQTLIVELLCKCLCPREEVALLCRQMEEWFLCIVEPNENDREWAEREYRKNIEGFCSACLPELKELIGPVRTEIRDYVVYLHRQLGFVV